MKRKILVLMILANMFLLMACGPVYYLGDTANLVNSHLVNPRDFGPYFWLLNQHNNCYLEQGLVEILEISESGEYVLLSDGNCMGWGVPGWLEPIN